MYQSKTPQNPHDKQIHLPEIFYDIIHTTVGGQFRTSFRLGSINSRIRYNFDGLN